MVRRPFGQPGDRHVAVADGLDLLHAVLRREPVEAAHELVQHRDRPLRAEPARQRDEPFQIRKEHRSLGKAFGDGLARLRLQPFDHAVGQDVAQQRLGLGFRRLGETEGVVGQGRRDAKGGEGRRHVKLPHQIGLDRRSAPSRAGTGTKPRGASTKHSTTTKPTSAGRAQPQDDEGRGRADDQVELDAGVAAEHRDEREQRRRLADQDQRPPASSWKRCANGTQRPTTASATIDQDDPEIGLEVVERIDQGVDRRRDRRSGTPSHSGSSAGAGSWAGIVRRRGRAAAPEAPATAGGAPRFNR